MEGQSMKASMLFGNFKMLREALMKRIILSAFFLFEFAILSSVAHADSHEFFKGKTVRLVVGTSAGGAQDEWARFLAPHLGRNIPGGPDIVVQNMPGAGSAIAANHIYNIAKPDGLTLGMFNPALYIDQLLGAKEVKFDWPKFSWIGSPERIDQILFIRTDFPQKTLNDFAKLQNRQDVQPRGVLEPVIFYRGFLRRGLGLKFKWWLVTGAVAI
jgi:tripartite-type tricarboxylate transporter receptor subunit TctC